MHNLRTLLLASDIFVKFSTILILAISMTLTSWRRTVDMSCCKIGSGHIQFQGLTRYSDSASHGAGPPFDEMRPLYDEYRSMERWQVIVSHHFVSTSYIHSLKYVHGLCGSVWLPASFSGHRTQGTAGAHVHFTFLLNVSSINAYALNKEV